MMKVKWAVGSRQWAVATPKRRRAPSTAYCLLPTAYYRSGVTLIELLITMAIMAIISAAILGTATAAMENARRNRTQVLITKIHGLILERLAAYESRRVDINPAIQGEIDKAVRDAAGNSAAFTAANLVRGSVMADARLLATRELVRMEMPDRFEDFKDYVGNPPPTFVLSGVSGVTRGYLRKYGAAQAEDNEAAECLYMAVMATTGDGEARTLFAKQDIGDTDGDGAQEFIDGWGQPIGWIRWPAGIVSDLQPLDIATGERGGHDPLDPYRRDQHTITAPVIGAYPSAMNFRGTYKDNIRDRIASAAPLHRKTAFRLVPLIYSAGPDGESAMLRAARAGIAPLDPYFNFNHNLASGGTAICQDGEIDPDNPDATKDNITNHLIEY